MTKMIGIDLGTTNSCAAFVSNKIPRVIPIEEGYNTMPSVVTMHQSGKILVGQAAKERMQTSPSATIYAVKRLLGRQHNSKLVQELKRRFGYEIVAGEGGEAAVQVGANVHSCAEIQGILLQQIKRYAEIHLGEAIPEVVISVPAYYSDHQRALVKEAGKLARWNVRRIVNEPTAAALAYGFNRGFDQKVLVYDLGGGTFDVSLLELTGNVFQVIATGGDTFLGGADFDICVLQWMLDEFRRQTKVDLAGDITVLQKLRDAAERAKIELSLLANTQVRLQGLVERRGKSLDLEMVLDRELLNDLTRGLVKRTLAVIDRVLGDKGIDKNSVDEVILVGGQTRMPLVADMLTAHLGKPPRKGVHPDECVALGAALLADSISKIDAVTLLDALSVPIGVADRDGQLQVVIDKHTQLPNQGATTVPTTQDSQTRMDVDIYQGEAGPVVDAEYLGTLKYDGIPEAAAGEVGLNLELSLNEEGMLAVKAAHSKGGKPRQVELTTIARPLPPREVVVDASEPETASDDEETGSGIKGLMRSLLGQKK